MSLRFLVVEGNTREVRERYRLDLGATPAEQYGAVLVSLAGTATFDILCPADPTAALPHNAALTDYDGVVLTGSALNLWKGEPESRRQVELAREIYRSNVPFFGSCWGIQVAAAAAGGEVRPNPRGREMGFARAITKSEAGTCHPLLAGRPAIFDAPCSHLDEVATLPPDATLLASNAVSVVQAAEFRFEGGMFWGVQYHPEFSPGIVAYLTEAMGERLIAEGFFADRAQNDQYAADLRLLDGADPPRHVSYRLGLGAELTDPARRMAEISNFIAHRVRPHRAAHA